MLALLSYTVEPHPEYPSWPQLWHVVLVQLDIDHISKTQVSGLSHT